MEKLIDYLPYIVSALLFFVNVLSMVYTRKTGKSIHNLEDTSMKYRTADYREKASAVAQTFDPLVTQYRYNKSSGELEELPDKLDIQKLIDSHVQTSLEAMFDKFLSPDEHALKQTVIEDDRDDLDRLSDAMEFADELRQKYGLDDTASLGEIYTVFTEDVNNRQEQLRKAEAKKQADNQQQALFEQFKAFMAQNGAGDKNET